MSEWKIDGNAFSLNVSIPANTKATVYCPSLKDSPVMENGNPIHVTGYKNGYAIIEIGSVEFRPVHCAHRYDRRWLMG